MLATVNAARIAESSCPSMRARASNEKTSSRELAMDCASILAWRAKEAPSSKSPSSIAVMARPSSVSGMGRAPAFWAATFAVTIWAFSALSVGKASTSPAAWARAMAVRIIEAAWLNSPRI